MSARVREESTTGAPALEPEASYKGFDLDLTCRGFQYEIGETYTHHGDVKACLSGFHACEYPLNVFDYYPPGSSSRYAETTQSGRLSRHDADTKIASATITIKAELRVHDLVERAVKWVVAQCRPADACHAAGDRSAASSTGDRSAASSTGDQSAASSTGYQSAAMASGSEGRVMCERDGCALFLVYRDPESGDILHAWAGITGRGGIKAGVWYRLDSDGQPAEASP